MSQVRYTVTKTKKSILSGAINTLAMQLAKKADDPLYQQYQECYEKLKNIKEKIRQKYGRQAAQILRNTKTKKE